MDNAVSSVFFEFISSKETAFPPGRERFESEHFIEFRPCTCGDFLRSDAAKRKKSVSRALALSTAFFVVSGRRRDRQQARRPSQNGGLRGTRQNRGWRSRAYRTEWDDLQPRQTFCSGVAPEGEAVCLEIVDRAAIKGNLRSRPNMAPEQQSEGA